MLSGISNSFQEKLQAKISEISSSSDIYVLSDKPEKAYSMYPEAYDKLIMKELLSNYKLANARDLDNINESQLELVCELDLLDRTRHNSLRTLIVLWRNINPILHLNNQLG